MEDHQPIVMENFKGHYNRGISDDIPPDFFRDTLNLRYASGEFRSREGSSLSINQGNIARFHAYKRLNENPRYLILDTSGNLYDSIFGLVNINPLWTDFSLLNFNNNAYITPHNRIQGLTNAFVMVWDGSTFRIAGGLAPTGFTLTATDSAVAGNVEFGTHLFAVSYEFLSGFITPPGPATFARLDARGFRKVTIGNIPTGPTGTVARRILATKVIPNYDGNQTGHTFYFIPDGRIADNSTLTFDVDFFDVDLFDSADYLFDQFDKVPAGLGLVDYNGRIALWGIPGSEHIVYLSKTISPESFDKINGFVTCYPSDNATGVKGCWVQRGNLYMRKAGSTYQTTDNGQDPVTWIPNRVDDGIGGELYCGARVVEKPGASGDKMFVAHISGLYSFNGMFSKPAISFNIENEWKRINRSQFNKTVVVHDPTTYSIYTAVCLDSATSLSHVFYCDYSEALDPIGFIIPTNCKWAIWQFQGNLSHIICDYDNNNNVLFKYSLTSGNIYSFDSTLHLDDGNNIHAYGATYLMGEPSEAVSHFDSIRLRLRGSGTLLITLTGEDEVLTLSPTSITSLALPGRALIRKFNFANERMSVKLEVNSAGDWFNVARLVSYANEQFAERPA